MATAGLILQSYLQTMTNEKLDDLRRNKTVDDLLEYNKKIRGGDFLIPLSFYLAILENTDEVMLLYMGQEKKDSLLRDLQVTYLLLLAQKKHERTHQKSENAKSYDSSLKRCQQLIDALNYKKLCEEQNIEPAPEYGYATDGYPVKFLGFFLGQELAEKIVDMMDRKTKTIKEAMGWFNEKRLYWVWGSGLLKTVLDALPPDFFNTKQAAQTIRRPDLYMGALSWILYYFRFALNLSLLLKHTIRGPWMDEEEVKTPWYERFQTQWDQRKFTLLNDSIWATGNLVCFFWLTGKSVLGTWGDALTLGLLVFDITLAVWDYEEQKTKYNKEMLNFDKEIAIVKELIKKEENDIKAGPDKKKVKEYRLQLDGLKRAQRQCQKDWDFQKISLMTAVGYAIGLMIAFVILTTPFLPITGPAVLAFGIAGAVLCFALTVIYNGVRGGLELYKTHTSRKEIKENYLNKIEEFHQLLLDNPDLNDNEKKFLFLEIKKLQAESEHQKQMIVFQTMHLFRSIIIETFIPALVFVSFVFLPLGIGFAALGAGLAFAIVSNLIIDTYKPEKEKLESFDEKEYAAFCADPDNWGKKSAKSAPGFFTETPNQKGTNRPIITDESDKPTDNEPLLGHESGLCSGFH